MPRGSLAILEQEPNLKELFIKAAAAGVSQVALAKLCKVHHSAIQQYFKKKVNSQELVINQLDFISPSLQRVHLINPLQVLERHEITKENWAPPKTSTPVDDLLAGLGLALRAIAGREREEQKAIKAEQVIEVKAAKPKGRPRGSKNKVKK